MNVLIVVPWDQVRGGVATVVNKLAGHLVSGGHRVLFLHPGDSSLRSRTTLAGFPGFELNMRSAFVAERPFRSLTAFLLTLPITLFRLVRLLRAQQIDVISIHYPLPKFVVLSLSRYFHPAALVVSAHGADLMPEGEHAWRHPLSLRWLLRDADRFTAPSQHSLNSFLETSPWLASRSLPVHNGIDLGDFYPQTPPVTIEDGGYLLCIAAHNRKKAIDTLLHAYALARARGLSQPLVLVGDGPLQSELKRLSQHLGIGDHVEFKGAVGLAEVRALLAGCTMLVLPSRSEPFGIVLLEAMAYGKAVVATRVGGIPEFVSHLDNGFLVEPDHPEELAGALCSVAGERALRERLGAEGERMVRSRFTHHHMGARYEAVFAEAISRKRSG